MVTTSHPIWWYQGDMIQVYSCLVTTGQNAAFTNGLQKWPVSACLSSELLYEVYQLLVISCMSVVYTTLP